MPYLSLRLTHPASTELARDAAVRLTDLVVDLLGKRRELTSVSVDFILPSQWLVGGEQVEEGTSVFYLDVKVTEGTNTKDEKARFVADAHNELARLAGQVHPASYVVIDEVRADAWGYAGKTQEFRYVQRSSL